MGGRVEALLLVLQRRAGMGWDGMQRWGVMAGEFRTILAPPAPRSSSW